MDLEALREERIQLGKKLVKKSSANSIFVEDVTSAADRMQLDDLEFRFKAIAEHKQAVISTMKSDEELKKAKNTVKTLNAPYNEQKRAANEKARFIGLLLQELKGFGEDSK